MARVIILISKLAEMLIIKILKQANLFVRFYEAENGLDLGLVLTKQAEKNQSNHQRQITRQAATAQVAKQD